MPDIDEDILRQLMTRATEDLVAPQAAVAQALRRQRRHRARVRVTAVAGTAAAAGLAAGVLLPGTGGAARQSAPGASSGSAAGGAASGTGAPAPARLTAAQRALFSLSAAAAVTSRPAGRYVVLTEQTTSIDSGGPSGATRETGPKTNVIDTVTGGGVTYQGITVTNANGTPTPPSVLAAANGTSPTRAQLDAWPTGTAALRAALLAQARQQQAQAQQFMDQKRRAEEKQLKGKKLTAPSQPRLSDDDLVFEQAADMLWQPDLSPALRSALYKVLAATPGVSVQTGVTDSSGRPATLISRRADSGGYTVKTYENPKTGATLESAWAGPGSSFDEDLYQSIRYTDTIPANPYKG